VTFLLRQSEALAAVFPATTLKTCPVHLIRHSLDFATWKERQPLAAALRPIYAPAHADAARVVLEERSFAVLTRDTIGLHEGESRDGYISSYACQACDLIFEQIRESRLEFRRGGMAEWSMAVVLKNGRIGYDIAVIFCRYWASKGSIARCAIVLSVRSSQ
jgi:hypothetical protein